MDAWFMDPGGSVTHRDPETKTTSTQGLWTGECVDMWGCVHRKVQFTWAHGHAYVATRSRHKRNDLETQDTKS